jgi:hypothetical protein
VNVQHFQVGGLDMAAKSAAVEQPMRVPILLQLARDGLQECGVARQPQRQRLGRGISLSE